NPTCVSLSWTNEIGAGASPLSCASVRDTRSPSAPRARAGNTLYSAPIESDVPAIRRNDLRSRVFIHLPRMKLAERRLHRVYRPSGKNIPALVFVGGAGIKLIGLRSLTERGAIARVSYI